MRLAVHGCGAALVLGCALAAETFAQRRDSAAAAPPRPARNATLPAVSPDARSVAYSSQRDGAGELYLLDLVTGLSRRLTYSPEAEGPPAWADSGRSIVFTRSRSDTTELLSMSPDGSGTRVRASLRARSVRLSNDGRRLALTRGSWTRSRLGVANADGSRFRALSDSAGAWYNLAWSPDDRWIAATRNDSTGSLHIRLVDPETGRQRELVRLAGAARPQWPAWSPDGRAIAFQAGSADSDATRDVHIHTVDVASGRVTRLREHPHPILDETPCWLDAERIVFQSTQSGAFELWVMRADGTGATRLTK